MDARGEGATRCRRPPSACPFAGRALTERVRGARIERCTLTYGLRTLFRHRHAVAIPEQTRWSESRTRERCARAASNAKRTPGCRHQLMPTRSHVKPRLRLCVSCGAGIGILSAACVMWTRATSKLAKSFPQRSWPISLDVRYSANRKGFLGRLLDGCVRGVLIQAAHLCVGSRPRSRIRHAADKA